MDQGLLKLVAECVGEVEAAPALVAWLEQVRDWNQRIDLTAARDDRELVDLMLADAQALAEWVPAAARVVDVGTGAGGPGLALALLREDLSLTLVEPLQKRAALLRIVAAPLGGRVAVLQQRVERLPAGGFDVAVSRATFPPARWLELGAALAPRVCVLLAREEPPRLPGWQVEHDRAYRWPLTGADRRVVVYRPSAG